MSLVPGLLTVQGSCRHLVSLRTSLLSKMLKLTTDPKAFGVGKCWERKGEQMETDRHPTAVSFPWETRLKVSWKLQGLMLCCECPIPLAVTLIIQETCRWTQRSTLLWTGTRRIICSFNQRWIALEYMYSLCGVQRNTFKPNAKDVVVCQNMLGASQELVNDF